MERNKSMIVSNMHCTNCSSFIEKYFNAKDSIKVTVLLSNNTAIFTYDDTIWTEALIEKHLKKIGYPRKKERKFNIELIKLLICIALAIPFYVSMISSFTKTMIHLNKYVQLSLATIILIVGGFNFIKGMIRDIKNKHLGMDVLVSLGVLSSYIYSLIILILNIDKSIYFETTSMLLSVIMIGKYIESKAKKKTGKALEELMSLQVNNANVLIDNEIVSKDIKDIKENDILIINNGQSVPLDGVIVSGTIDIDESMISGESLPVNKTINETVLAGSMVVNGSANIKVIKNVDDTYLSSIIKKVETIINEKPRLQKTADKVANIFVPTVIILALLCFLITLLIYKNISISIDRAIAVLMISCPCSLGLATPLSILIGSSIAIKKGIIFNNTDIFEKSVKIDTICFDKTGTISKGVLSISNATYDDPYYLSVLYTLEAKSNHPIAKAIIKYAKDNNAKIIDCIIPNEIVGKGIEYDDYFAYKENNVVYLKKGNDIKLTLEVNDEIKEDAKKVIDDLTNNKIDVFLISGDSKQTTLSIAESIGINKENVFYKVDPTSKLSIIKKLKEKNRNVCFVGDGINDTLALNESNLSIAMGSGSDIAKSSSDITLSNNNLSLINLSIVMSKKVYRNIVVNFIWAFSYNIIAIPLVFFGKIPMMLSGIFMAFSSIMVVLNSLRLYIGKYDNK